MKKRKLLPLAALVLVLALAAWVMFAPKICVAPIEQRSDDHWSLLHVYMTGEYEYTLPAAEGQLCDFQWVTGRGSFSAELTNADGTVLYTAQSGRDGKIELPAASDLTLHLKTKGHGGYFALTLKDDPSASEQRIYQAGLANEKMFRGGFYCEKEAGELLNFYVENRGEDPVVIRVNGRYDRIIQPGSAGHITAPIDGDEDPQEMVATCISTRSNGINIFWKVAQRHE